MYYILNKTNQIIGADESFLKLYGVNNIDDLYLKVINEKINLTPIEDKKIRVNNQAFHIEEVSISTLLGDIHLISLSEAVKDTQEKESISNIASLDLDDISEELEFEIEDVKEAKSKLPIEEPQIAPEPTKLEESTKTDENELDLDLELFNTTSAELESELKESEIASEPTKLEESTKTDEMELDLDSLDLFDDTPKEVKPEITSEPTKLEESTKTDDDLELDLDSLDLFDDTPKEVKPETVPEPTKLEETAKTDENELDLDSLDLFDDTPKEVKPETVPEPTKLEESTKTDEMELDLDSLDLFDDTPKEVKPETVPEPTKLEESTKTDENELDLDSLDLFDDTPKDDIKDIDLNIDIESISQSMGISTDDYQEFLDDFINTAHEVEDDIKSDDEDRHSEALETLSNLTEILQLPHIKQLLAQDIELFYKTISKIDKSSKEDDAPLELFDETKADIEQKVEDDITKEEPEVTIEETVEEEPAESKGFGTIDLSNVKPKHFDFQLEVAADELSLPVDLIEEFVHDFIEQAHEETPKMLKFYEEGNLDAIQKIGHLLKGASSNLRINPLADTLFKIQFCEQPNQLEMLIKDYWAHFLSLENQIKVISN